MISFSIGFTTKPGMYPWYTDLKKSSFTPPGYVFGIVWPILYCSLAIFGYHLYKRVKTPEILVLFKLYCLQMALNWLWSPVFFNLHLTLAALIILILIVSINACIILRLIKIKSSAYYIIVPYFLWICFALYLNLVIVAIN